MYISFRLVIRWWRKIHWTNTHRIHISNRIDHNCMHNLHRTLNCCSWSTLLILILIYIYIYIYNCVFGSLISDVTCHYVCLLMGEGWPVVACPFRALVVLYRMLTIFACYVLTFMFGMLFLFLTISLGCFCPRILLFEKRTEHVAMDLIYMLY